MLESLLELDRSLFFFLNGLHTPVMDTIMYWYTNKLVWIPFYLALIYWVFRTHGVKGFVFVLGAAAAAGLADLIISGAMKPFFERFRPSRDPDFMEHVHIVNEHRGGRYGFASSHAGTAFAVATFFYLLFKSESKWVWLLFLWASIMAYTRVYLGVHYPGDILVGGIIGIGLGVVLFLLAKYLYNNYLRKT